MVHMGSPNVNTICNMSGNLLGTFLMNKARPFRQTRVLLNGPIVEECLHLLYCNNPYNDKTYY